jgi:hypothetical protein
MTVVFNPFYIRRIRVGWGVTSSAAHLDPPCHWELPGLQGILSMLATDLDRMDREIFEQLSTGPPIHNVIWNDILRLLASSLNLGSASMCGRAVLSPHNFVTFEGH